ncbi:SAM-dependent chlorinase/fluorinase [Desulfosarcina sp.]|uniref:SAM hydrolase/SAM-dependent halogenase family protein n=1 Tax=Desulfosarcina sp. TaxID=2027861 RepID=UPI0029AF4167|nr:SAM-dependent chlorinase/fluorinase [Desulfosarcina sp.]MDX2452396.1 SAM-dependent chlorinase/fluorinase [Desulfosarcina sp.]
MSIVTLLTDFGLEDAWVGIMKGVILGINPEARIVDITHQIPPQDTAVAAWTMAAAYPYFPPGTVHIIVVDPGVGSDRDIICARLGDHIFVAPDNGVLSSVLESGAGTGDIRIVKNSDLWLDSISNTFHGRDILAPVGAHLSLSQDIASTGPAAVFARLVHLDLPKPVLTDSGELWGTVVMIDHFGNIITNIDRTALETFQAANGGCRSEIALGNHRIRGLSDAYFQAKAGQPLALFGSMGYLEIAIFGQDARREMKLARGDQVKVFRAGTGPPVTGS